MEGVGTAGVHQPQHPPTPTHTQLGLREALCGGDTETHLLGPGVVEEKGLLRWRKWVRTGEPACSTQAGTGQSNSLFAMVLGGGRGAAGGVERVSKAGDPRGGWSSPCRAPPLSLRVCVFCAQGGSLKMEGVCKEREAECVFSLAGCQG